MVFISQKMKMEIIHLMSNIIRTPTRGSFLYLHIYIIYVNIVLYSNLNERGNNYEQERTSCCGRRT